MATQGVAVDHDTEASLLDDAGGAPPAHRQSPLWARGTALATTLVAASVSALACSRWTSGTKPHQAIPADSHLVSQAVVSASIPTSGPLCGIASTDFSLGKVELQNAVKSMDQKTLLKLWHTNRQTTTSTRANGSEFYPTMQNSGATTLADIPAPGKDGVGHRMFGWFHVDNGDTEVHSNPEKAARNWTADMLLARSKGYTEVVAPTIGDDPCWLDFFLKGCEQIPECPNLVSHISFSRLRTDCAEYKADMQNEHFRDDLGYIMSFGRIREKYNTRGFAIKGLILAEMGCVRENGLPADSKTSARYAKALLQDTIVKVRDGDESTIDNISNAPDARWIGFFGPDAHRDGAVYSPNSCKWQDPGEGAFTGMASVRAVRALAGLAWANLTKASAPVRKVFYDSCMSIKDTPAEGWERALNGAQG